VISIMIWFSLGIVHEKVGHLQGAPAEQDKAADCSVSGYTLKEANAVL